MTARQTSSCATSAGWRPSPGPRPALGAALRDLALVEHAALAAREGRIVWAGPRPTCRRRSSARRRTVSTRRAAAVVPGFVDAHTHLAFAGDRDDEIRRRLAGAQLSRDRRSGRRHRAQRRRRRAAPASRSSPTAIAARLDEMLLPGHDHGRGQERLRARHRRPSCARWKRSPPRRRAIR